MQFSCNGSVTLILLWQNRLSIIIEFTSLESYTYEFRLCISFSDRIGELNNEAISLTLKYVIALFNLIWVIDGWIGCCFNSASNFMTTNYFKKLLENIEDKLFLSDKFHLCSNNKHLKNVDPKKAPEHWIRIHFKTYPRLQKIHLHSPKKISYLSKILRERFSARNFSGKRKKRKPRPQRLKAQSQETYRN